MTGPELVYLRGGSLNRNLAVVDSGQEFLAYRTGPEDAPRFAWYRRTEKRTRKGRIVFQFIRKGYIN